MNADKFTNTWAFLGKKGFRRVIGSDGMGKHEKAVRLFSFVAIAIAVCLLTSLYFFRSEKVADALETASERSLLHQNFLSLCSTNTEDKSWEYIVIHHSATEKGNAAEFDEYHREKRGWKHGLAYHFVIGNGSHSGDGEVEVGNRWKNQIHGAHTANMDCNRVGIGICLVGNFEDGAAPTENQFESLVNLVQHLSRRYDIPPSNVILHKQVHQKGTACPGKNFPYDKLKINLMQFASNKGKDIQQS